MSIVLSNLLEFPQSLLEPILSEWVYDVDLCNLDTAVCNSELRNYFLGILLMSTALSNPHNYFLSDKYYEWIYLRGMSLSYICLSDIQCRSPTPAVLYALSTHRICCIRAPACAKLVQRVQSCKFRLKSLHLIGLCNLNVLSSVLQILGPTIEYLDLIQCQCLSTDTSSTIVQLCPNLHELLSFNIDMLPILTSCPLEKCHIKLLRLVGEQTVTDRSSVDIALTHEIDCPAFNIGGKRYCVKGLSLSITNQEEVNVLMAFLSSIKSLDIFWTAWSLVEVVVSRCSQLTSLTIDCFDMDENEFVNILSQLSQLTMLRFPRHYFTDIIGLAAAQHCPLLENFCMEESGVSSYVQRELMTGCPHLKWFVCHSVIVEDLLLAKAVNLDKLDFHYDADALGCVSLVDGRLSVSNTLSLSRDCFIKYLTQNPNVTDISLHGQEYLDNKSVEMMAVLCPRLKQISISSCKKVTSVGLYALKSCTVLKAFQYETAHKVNKLDLKRLLVSTMKSLSVPRCKDLPDGSLSAIAEICPGIEFVDVSFCTQVTNDGVIALLNGCRKLKTLSLEGCRNVTAAILPSIKCNQQLKTVNVRDTRINYHRQLREFKATSEVLFGFAEEYNANPDTSEENL